jgi:hypothetical protein
MPSPRNGPLSLSTEARSPRSSSDVQHMLVRGSAGSVLSHKPASSSAAFEPDAYIDLHDVEEQQQQPLQRHASFRSDTSCSSLPAQEAAVAEVMPACLQHYSLFFAVLFAVFINLLDACTFGTILFPSDLSQYAAAGISSFLFSTAVVQLVFILASDFRCGLGTSQAENIPFVSAHSTTLQVSLDMSSLVRLLHSSAPLFELLAHLRVSY